MTKQKVPTENEQLVGGIIFWQSRAEYWSAKGNPEKAKECREAAEKLKKELRQ